MKWPLLLAAVTLTGSAQSGGLSPQLANAFEKKIVLVQSQAEQKASKDRPTTFSQAETNSYLKFKTGDLLPTGLTQPELTMIGGGKVSGKAIVDLDVVREKQGSGSWFDPTSYLTGKLPVTAAGRIVTWDGKGKFELETATINGIPLPKSLLAQMVNFFTRTSDNPRGSSIDDTFELPANIKTIDVNAGSWTTHQ
jgi:hypothetical protein